MIDTHLSNGLRVIVAPWRAAPVVSVQVWVRVGSADEAPEEAGLAHVHEHMVFKGTDRRGVGDVAKEIESAGGEINAYTSLDHTVYHCTLSHRDIDIAMDVLADAVFNSRFDPDELERELEVVIEELLRGRDDHGRVASEMLFAQVFQTHPYGRPVIGHRDTIESFSRDAVLRFFRRWYQPANCCLVVAGDVDPEEALARAERFFGGLDSAAVTRPVRPAEPELRAPRAHFARRAIQESHLLMGWKGTTIQHPDTPALDLLAVILGAGESSRLYRELKRNREAVADAFALSHAPQDPGLVGAGAMVQGDDVEGALTGLCEVVLQARQRPVPAEELEKAKTIILSEQVYQNETVDGWARKLGYYATTVRHTEFEARYYEAVRTCTPDEVHAAARRYLAPERACVVGLLAEEAASPLDDARALELVDALPRPRAQRRTTTRAGARGVVCSSLSNGCRVIVQADRILPRVAIRTASLGGLLAEQPEEAGVSHLAARLLTRGTRSLSVEQIIERCDAMAAGLGGISGRNSLGLSGDFLESHWEAGFELFVSCLLEPRFDPAEIDRERKSQLEDIIARLDSPAAVAFDAFESILKDPHPYGRPLLGAKETIDHATAELVKRVYWRQTVPERMVVAVVGAVDPERTIDQLEEALGGFRSSEPGFDLPEEPRVLARAVERELTMKREQAHLVMGTAGASLEAGGRHALDVLATVLGGQSGRLFMELRDRRSLAYSVGAFHLDGVHAGSFATHAATRPERVDEAEAAIRNELMRLRDTLEEDDVTRAQKYLVGSHEIGLQRATSRSSAMALMEAYGQGYDEPYRYSDRIRAVRPQDVRDAAAGLADAPGWVTVRVLPEPDLDRGPDEEA